MVAGSPRQPQPTGLNAAPGLERWCATLQQASQLESDRGFGDLMGRRETYSTFILRSLREGSVGLSDEERRSLAELAQRFLTYPNDPPERRARLVSQIGRAHV